MLLATLTLIATATSPEPFHAAFGLKSGSNYTYRVEKTVTEDGQMHRTQVDYVIRLISDPGEPDVLSMTIKFSGEVTKEQMVSLFNVDEDVLEIPVEFVLDENHAIVGMRDWTVHRDAGIALGTAMLRAKVEAGLTSQESADIAVEYVTDTFATYDAMLEGFVGQMSPFLFGYGWTLVPGEPILDEYLLPTLISQATLPATVTVELNDDPETEGIVEFIGVSRVNGEALVEPITTLGRALDAPIEDDFEDQLSRSILVSSVRWSYDQALKVLSSIAIELAISGPGVHEFQTSQWTLIDAPGMR
ncbi:MAG: hypothetical protein AAGI53_15920 [Planctomycetota bacterium]